MLSSAAARRFAPGARPGASRPDRLLRGFGGRLHLTATLFLLFSLFAPLAALSAAAAPAAPQPAMRGLFQGGPDAPPPLPAPTQAALAGDFQEPLLGHRGVFTAVLPIPPGDYAFRIEVLGVDGQQRSLGEDADPNGDDIEVDVPGNAAGLYISYDYRTGEIVAEPTPTLVTMTIQRPDEPVFTVAARPIGGGDFELYFSGAAGANLYEVAVDGQPVTQGQFDLPDNARVLVTLDDQGNVVDQEIVPQAGLTVTKVDQNDALQPGSCFALFDANDLVTQACDVDDGADGNTFLLFLNGIEGGGDTFELVETFVPDGQNAVEEQDVTLNNQEFTQTQVVAAAEAQPEPEETPEPTPEETAAPGPGPDEPGTITILFVDEDGDPIRGGSYTVTNDFGTFGPFEDDDEPGRIELTQVPPGDNTIAEDAPPEGFVNIGQTVQTVTVDPGEDETVTFTYASEEPEPAPTPEPTATTEVQPAGVGTVIVEARDQDGNLIEGGCYQGANQIGPYGPECDGDDGPEDGRVEFTNLGPGEQQIGEVSPPPGYERVGPAQQTVEVGGGQTETVVFEYVAEGQPEPEEPGSIAIRAEDEAGNTIQAGCYTVTNVAGTFPADPSGFCDNDGNGEILLTGVPTGDNTIAEVSPPEGYQNVGETVQTVVVESGEEETVTFTYAGEEAEPTPEVTEEPEPTATAAVQPAGLGQVIVEARDQDGNLIEGGCYQGANQIGPYGPECDGDDGPEDGRVEFTNLGPGEQQIGEVSPPPGYERVGPAQQTVEVGGGQTETVVFEYVAEGEPEPEPDELGTLTILLRDEDDQPVGGGTYAISSDGETIGEFEDEDLVGRLGFADVPPGVYTIEVVEAPEDYQVVGDSTQDVEVGPGEDASLTFTFAPVGEPAPTTGTLTILIQDDAGNTVGGACYTVTNAEGTHPQGDPNGFCDNDGDGEILLTQVTTGPNTVTEVQPPVGDFGPAEATEQTVDVDPGEDETVTFVYPAEAPAPETGTLRYIRTDEAGNPVGGACILLEGIETIGPVCDNQEGDVDGDPGEIEIQNLPPDSYLVSETTTPEEVEPPEADFATILPGQTEVYEVSTAATAPPTGDLVVVVTDGEGNPVGGTCFELLDPETGEVVVEEVCDEDGDLPDDGRVGFIGIEVGSYVLRQTQTNPEYEGAPEQPVDVPEGGIQIDVTNAPIPPETGELRIVRRNNEGEVVGGGCYAVTDTEGATVVEGCDNDGVNDANNAEGEVRFPDLPAGEVTVTEVQAPPGLVQADPQETTIPPGGTARVAFETGPSLGSMIIFAADENGDPLGLVCYQVDNGAGSFGPFCDDENGTGNGQVVLSEVWPGDNTVTPTSAPAGYALPEPQVVPVVPGEEAQVTFAFELALGAVEITKTDQTGAPLGGACFELVGGPANYGPVCDNQDGDANDQLGVIRLEGVLVGDYTLSETEAPDGYDPAGDQPVTVTADETTPITIQNQPTGGAVEIVKQDEGGAPLDGSCFSLVGDQTYGPVCDNQEGDPDDDVGVIRFENVAPSTYDVVEETVPAGYEPAATIDPVTVEAGQVATVPVVNTLPAPEPGGVEITKTDPDGNLLEGACFVLQPEDGDPIGPVCDNQDGDADPEPGVLLIEELAVGTYVVTEETAPEGYAPVETLAPVTATVEEGEVTPLTVPNRPVAPETGSVQILKTGEGDQPLGGACFVLAGDETYGPVCDNGEGDGAGDVEGTILITGVLPGTYDVVEETVPAGYLAPEAIEPVTVVAGDEPAVVAVANQPDVEEAGSLEITKTDEEGNLLGGACFGLIGPAEVAPVCDNSPADGNPETGLILITGIVPGDYTLSETQPPTGYVAAADRPVTIEAGDEPATETVENSASPPPVGSVQVRKEDPDGNLILGACFRLTAADGSIVELCDNAPNDPATEVGIVRFDGIVEGEATVEETAPPRGYVLPDPTSQGTTVVADDVVLVIFVDEPEDTEGETGGLLLQLEDQDGDPATTEEPFFLRRYEDTQEIVLGPFEDNGADDADDRVGFVLLEDVPVGTWSIYQPLAPPVEGFATASLSDFQEKTVTVQANIVIVVIIIIIIVEPEEGDLLVFKRVVVTNVRIPGSCFRLESLDDPPTAFGICDNDFMDVETIDPTLTSLSDTDGRDGALRFDEVPAGDYTLIEIRVPTGYTGGDPVEIEVVGGATRSIAIYNTPVPEPRGDLIVYKVDDEDNPLEGACFELRNLANTAVLVDEICDGDTNDGDGASNGQILFEDIVAQQYRLRETDAPAGYTPGASRLVTVLADGPTEVTVVNTLELGTVIIEKRAQTEDGDLLVGACFRLDGEGGAPNYAELCDDDDPAGLDGETVFNGIEPGSYVAVETDTPSGYDADDPQPFDLDPGETQRLVFVNVLLPPPPTTGDLIVYKVDQHGAPLPGACFSLRQGAVTVRGPVCDSTDGISDGIIRFDDVGIGTLTLREVRKPSADYQTVADREVTIRANRTTQVTIQNVLRPGRILIRKTSTYDQPLQGACFDVSPDGKGPKCTDANGEVVFDGLVPGTYRIRETQPPAGYAQVPTVRNVVVKPGATTIVTIVDPPLPPPPDTGSIRIIKFYCPAGKGGEFTQIYDSSDPGGVQLAKTVGCDPGDATFTLTRVGGEGGPGTISTGADGTYQVTLAAGTYRLTETSPQFGDPADRTERLVVSRNQQTTIVVINYVAPPPPAPVDIVVIKYTCDPGFAGTLYVDFLNNCGDRSQLTNGVTFRISGQATGKAVTGDRGEKGVTIFNDVPAGQYTLKEEPPAWTTVYVFCGLDVNNPTLKAVSNQIAFTLKPGQRISCVFFNVPAEVTDTTGAILIHKLTCPVLVPPAGYDFEANCRPQQFSVQFSLAIYNGELRRFQPLATGATNADGLLRFSRLQAGTYELKEIGQDWCFAESNSVNAQGNVIVRPNQLAEVWIYNCNPTKGPPNTGTGAAAGLASAVAGGAGSASLALGLAWPLLGLAGWRLRQGRRRAA